MFRTDLLSDHLTDDLIMNTDRKQIVDVSGTKPAVTYGVHPNGDCRLYSPFHNEGQTFRPGQEVHAAVWAFRRINSLG